MTATAQTTDIAATSLRTVDDCKAKLQVVSERLDKTLDAFEKAKAVIAAKDAEIEARKTLEGLYKEWIAVKDQMIAAQGELIKFYQSQKNKSGLRKFFEKVEKVLLVAGALFIGSKF